MRQKIAALETPVTMIDLSDGLAGDAAHLAASSAVQVRIALARLPLDGSLVGQDLPDRTCRARRPAATGRALGRS